MLTDLQIIDLLQAQYDGKTDDFDFSGVTEGVSWAIKLYPDETLVACEGSHNPRDWLRDAQFILAPSPYGGRAEFGFSMGVPATVKVILPNIPYNKPVTFAGHSLGASHAHLLARAFICEDFHGYTHNIRRVVFGSPRVGDREFCQGLVGSPVRSYRNYRNFFDQDFVTSVPTYIPFISPYAHPGDYIYIDVPGDEMEEPLFRRHHLPLYRQGVIQCHK